MVMTPSRAWIEAAKTGDAPGADENHGADDPGWTAARSADCIWRAVAQKREQGRIDV